MRVCPRGRMEISTALRLSAAVGNACLAKQIRLLHGFESKLLKCRHVFASPLPPSSDALLV